LVSANGKGFLRGLGWWFALALPSTYTNAMVSYPRTKLIRFAFSSGNWLLHLGRI
jgi:hypothetical protein